MPAAWSTFRRRDLTSVIGRVREIAEATDPGTNGHGVELVVQSPRLLWWQRPFRKRERDQARIAITGIGGRAGYPIHVRLITPDGGDAIRKVDRRDGWATSNTNGNAYLMLKRGPAPVPVGTPAHFDPLRAAAEVVTGTVAALAGLHPFVRDRGWRYRVDRDVLRR